MRKRALIKVSFHVGRMKIQFHHLFVIRGRNYWRQDTSFNNVYQSQLAIWTERLCHTNAAVDQSAIPIQIPALVLCIGTVCM